MLAGENDTMLTMCIKRTIERTRGLSRFPRGPLCRGEGDCDADH
jgi:hypothetical protein